MLRWARARRAPVALLVALGLLLGLPATAASAGTGPASDPVAGAPAVSGPALCPPGTVAVRTAELLVGTTVPWGPLDAAALAGTADLLGRPVGVVSWYTGFGEAPDVGKLQAVVDAGAVPMITWESWDWTGDADQPDVALARILAGDHDATIRRFADDLARWGGPVLLRWGHEMNGSWYPWGASANGNTPAEFVAAWRHLHGLFDERGADAVTWVWSPNEVFPGSTPLADVFPGAAYVDAVAVDGYNWGTSVPGRRWTSPGEIFDATFAQVRALAPGVPLLVAETASTELGGDKAAWVADLFAWARAQPDLVGVVWFDEDKETDWRMRSSPAAAAAFRTALAG